MRTHGKEEALLRSTEFILLHPAAPYLYNGCTQALAIPCSPYVGLWGRGGEGKNRLQVFKAGDLKAYIP